jgi:hypothetical protein
MANAPSRLPKTKTVLSLAVAALGVSLCLAALFAMLTSVSLPTTGLGGREAVRFPGYAKAGPALGERPMHCGIVARRRRGLGTLEIAIQAGAVVRAADSSFDSYPGATEELVPQWARDKLIPWGWDGPWQVGMASTRRLYANGWPWPALVWVVRPSVQNSNGQWLDWRALAESGNPVPLPLGNSGTIRLGSLPFSVLWDGLMASALVLWLPVLGILGWGTWVMRRIPRWIRLRRGLCPHCAYPLKGSPVSRCPECGETSNSARRPKSESILP